MSAIVGLDLSLTATGICDQDECKVITAKSTGMQRLLDLRYKITDFLDGAKIVIIEGYSYGSKNSHAHALGELGGAIRLWLYTYDIPYVDIPPAVLKRFGTGKGNAGKDQMIATAARLGCPADDNNLVDAWWLLQMGKYHYLQDRRIATGYRDEVVAKVDWPEVAA